MNKWYTPDLAYVHDVGFGDHAANSAPGILGILARARINGGLVVDLGCGSGLLAEQLARAKYQVLGIDISRPMIDIARKRVPAAEFRVGSLFSARIPPCKAVMSIGECLNYMFDSAAGPNDLRRVFSRVHDSLSLGGVFIFDIAEPGQVGPGKTVKSFTEGKDWVVLVEKKEDAERSILTRKIITFRKAGQHYRRVDEIHRQRLYKAGDIASALRLEGFRVRTIRKYGNYLLPRRHAAFIARKVE